MKNMIIHQKNPTPPHFDFRVVSRGGGSEVEERGASGVRLFKGMFLPAVNGLLAALLRIVKMGGGPRGWR